MLSDKQCFKLIESGEKTKIEEGFAAIYANYYRLVYFVISKNITVPQDIEELTNDVFVNFFNNFDKLNDKTKIKSYLYTISHNIVINFLKKSHQDINLNEEDFVDVDANKNSSFVYSDLITTLKEFLDVSEIKIVIMYDIYGYSLQDISKELNLNYNTIKSTYRRSQNKLKKGGKLYAKY
ncbi:MAG: sigma-70 family RNA polymerase sigma factor [Bacilli bacterium]